MDPTRPRILIVDDEVEITRALTRMLRNRYETQTAGSGPQALKVLETYEPALVLSDFRMPELTGIEFLREVAKRYPQIQRVLMSGNAEHDSVQGWVAAGEIQAFIPKPWNREELIAKLAELLPPAPAVPAPS